MPRTRWIIVTPLLLAFAFSGSGFAQSLPLADIPAYNSKPPVAAAKLPPILRPDQLPVNPQRPAYVARAYRIAARIHRTLFQLPCYCHCDHSIGHNSLRSCYADDHGSECATCLQELFYANQMLKQGKSAQQIRDGIMHGDYQQIDLSKV